MSMKPGATTSPFAVDHDVAGLRLDVADRDDAVVDEADIGAPQRRAGAVGQISPPTIVVARSAARPDAVWQPVPPTANRAR